MYTYILSKSQNIKSAKLERVSFCWDDWEGRSNMNKTGFSRFFVLLIDIKKSDEYFLNYFLEDNKLKRDNIFFEVFSDSSSKIWIQGHQTNMNPWKCRTKLTMKIGKILRHPEPSQITLTDWILVYNYSLTANFT